MTRVLQLFAFAMFIAAQSAASEVISPSPATDSSSDPSSIDAYVLRVEHGNRVWTEGRQNERRLFFSARAHIED